MDRLRAPLTTLLGKCDEEKTKFVYAGVLALVAGAVTYWVMKSRYIHGDFTKFSAEAINSSSPQVSLTTGTTKKQAIGTVPFYLTVAAGAALGWGAGLGLHKAVCSARGKRLLGGTS